MSDTPRTDSSELPHALDDHHFVVGAFFARQLERELNAASKERDDALMMLGMYRMKSDEQNQRIKRLEEALDTLTCVIGLTPIKGNLAALQEAFDMARTVLKAKEAKP